MTRFYIVPIEDEERNLDTRFVGQIRSFPELILCKDCKKYYPKTEERDSYCPFVGRIGLEPEGYCAWAERKDHD